MFVEDAMALERIPEELLIFSTNFGFLPSVRRFPKGLWKGQSQTFLETWHATTQTSLIIIEIFIQATVISQAWSKNLSIRNRFPGNPGEDNKSDKCNTICSICYTLNFMNFDWDHNSRCYNELESDFDDLTIRNWFPEDRGEENKSDIWNTMKQHLRLHGFRRRS